MENIEVHRYNGDVGGWAGYVEPESRNWILFIGTDGGLALWDAKTEQVVATL